jgi:hypothetical protein
LFKLDDLILNCLRLRRVDCAAAHRGSIFRRDVARLVFAII